MIYLSLIFWLAMLLPGYAAMRWFAPRFVQGGLLGTIAISMLATFALASPVNILGHTFSAPLWLFTVWLIVLVIAAITLITKQKWWRDIRTLLIGGLCLELLIIAVDLVLSARLGSDLLGDAHTHLSRIRFIMDHGLNNGHPFYGGAYFFPTYHTNIWHSFIASASQLLGLRHHDVWSTALPVATLLIVGSFWQLAWTIFQRQWPAWIAALFVLGAFISVPFLTYPNKIAPLWITPLLIVFVIEIIRQPDKHKTVLLIAAGALVLGQVHGLYAIFAALMLGPVLIGALLYKIIRKEKRAAIVLTIAGIALATGVVFPAYSTLRTQQPAPTLSAVDNARTTAETTSDAAPKTKLRTHRFGKGFTGKWWRMPLVLAVAVVLFLVLKQSRIAIAVMVAAFLSCGAWLWLPPLYTWLTPILGADWAIARMDLLLKSIFFIIVAGGITALGDHWLSPRFSKHLPVDIWRITSLAAIPISIWLFAPKNDYKWDQYLTNATAPAKQRRFRLNSFHILQDFAQKEIPDGSVILAPLRLGLMFTTLTDCEVVYAYNNNLGALDRKDRELDLTIMLDPTTFTSQRNSLLDKYNISHVVYVSIPQQWAQRQADSVQSIDVPLLENSVTIVRLRPHDQ